MIRGDENWGRYLLAVVAAAFAVMVLCMIAVIVVDPFFHYHRPLAGFPYIVDNDLSQNPGMAARFDYDGLITGSSMTMNFHPDDFAELFGLKMIKLPYGGAYPADIGTMLDIAYDSRKDGDVPPLRMAVIAVDPPTLTADTDEHKFAVPEYLYDDNPVNDVFYVLNREVLWQYVLRPAVQRKATDMNTVYDLHFSQEDYDRDKVLAGYEPAVREERIAADALIPRTDANLEANYLAYVREHPETEFIFFYPPYSILYWNDEIRRNKLDATLTQIEYVSGKLLDCPNARVFYFQDLEDFVTDLDNYADYTHYLPAFNRYMTECFLDGTYELKDSGDIDSCLAHMREIVENYDFSSLPIDDN